MKQQRLLFFPSDGPDIEAGILLVQHLVPVSPPNGDPRHAWTRHIAYGQARTRYYVVRPRPGIPRFNAGRPARDLSDQLLQSMSELAEVFATDRPASRT